jgi:hypothetical protein
VVKQFKPQDAEETVSIGLENPPLEKEEESESAVFPTPLQQLYSSESEERPVTPEKVGSIDQLMEAFDFLQDELYASLNLDKDEKIRSSIDPLFGKFKDTLLEFDKSSSSDSGSGYKPSVLPDEEE